MTDKRIEIVGEVEVGTEIGRDLLTEKGVEIEIRGVAPGVQRRVGLEIEVIPEKEIRDQRIHESLGIIEVLPKSAEVGLAVVLEDRKGVQEVDPIVVTEVTQKRGDIEELRAKRRAVNINSFVLKICLKGKTFADKERHQ